MKTNSGNPTDGKKRGDIWIILSFLVPLSVSFGTIQRIGEVEGTQVQARYILLQWYPFQIVRGSGDWETTLFRFLNPPGNPLYLFFSYLVLFLILLAVFIRLRQHFQTRNGIKIDSGTVGALVSAAAIFEAAKIPLFRLHASELYLTHIGLPWNTEGVSRSGMILPMGIILLLLAAYQEYQTFSIEFKSLTSNIIRFSVIGLFMIISLFPLIWILLVSLNVNDVLRAGVLIWPLAGDRPMTFDAWRRLFHFDPAPGHTLVEGIIFLAGALIAFCLMVVVFIKRAALMERVEILLDRYGMLKTRYWLPTILIYAFMAILGIASFLGARLADLAFDWLYYQVDARTGAITRYAIGNWFTITLLICTTVTLLAIVLASLSGYAISRFRFVGRGALAALILSTQVFPGIILVLPLYIMSARLGLTGTLTGLGIAYSVIALPICTFLMKGYFDAIPADLEEQAMVDGCTRIQAYRRVIMPLALPGIASTFLFAFLAMYTEYLLALQIYKPTETEAFTISLAMLNVFQADITQRGVYFNDLAVFSILVAAPILIGFVYLQRFLLKGMVSGAVKG